jgi:hypothetical protein
MKNSDIIKIYRGLSHLIEPADHEGKPVKPYVFSGSASYAIIKNLRKAKAAVETFDATRNSIVKGLMKEGETSITPSDERFAKFQAELVKVLESEGDFSPHKLKISDLDLETNKIQPSVLIALEAILLDEEAPVPTSDASAPSGV